MSLVSKSGYTLYPPQQWAVDKLKSQPNVGFWDDMGVGKTIEAIAMDAVRRRQDWPNAKTLVVTLAGPTVNQWAAQFAEWQPNLKVVTLDPKRRDRSWAQFRAEGDVFIMHWEAVRLMPQLRDITWLHIIADEVHKIVARDTAVTKTFKKIKAGYKTGLSGTPSTGAPDKLWSILNWLYPKDYRSYWSFFEEYIIWELDDSQRYKKIVGIREENIPALQEAMEKFTVRRLLREVRPDMPDRLPPEVIYVDLLPEQRKAYDEMEKDMIAWVASREKQDGSEWYLDPIVAQAAVSRLTRLLQFSCAYAHVEESYDKDGEIVRTVRLTEPSSKLDACMAKIEEALEQGIKLVVFADFRQLIELLNARLERAGIPYATIHGKIPQADRWAQQQKFQVGDAVVCTVTRAGGTGIDLFAGQRIIILAEDWSPHVNEQVIGRIDRIGQTEAIQAIYIRSSKTIEADKTHTVALKWSWMRKVLGDDRR